MDALDSGSELFLILHKVRGEPAFDIAECIGEDSDGEVWIIPTSGHRAYPYWSEPLNRAVDFEMCRVNGNQKPDVMPDDWPDHYTVKAQDGGYGHKEYRREAVSDLLSRLGLKRKPSLTRRLPK